MAQQARLVCFSAKKLAEAPWPSETRGKRVYSGQSAAEGSQPPEQAAVEVQPSKSVDTRSEAEKKCFGRIFPRDLEARFRPFLSDYEFFLLDKNVVSRIREGEFKGYVNCSAMCRSTGNSYRYLRTQAVKKILSSVKCDDKYHFVDGCNEIKGTYLPAEGALLVACYLYPSMAAFVMQVGADLLINDPSKVATLAVKLCERLVTRLDESCRALEVLQSRFASIGEQTTRRADKMAVMELMQRMSNELEISKYKILVDANQALHVERTKSLSWYHSKALEQLCCNTPLDATCFLQRQPTAPLAGMFAEYQQEQRGGMFDEHAYQQEQQTSVFGDSQSSMGGSCGRRHAVSDMCHLSGLSISAMEAEMQRNSEQHREKRARIDKLVCSSCL
eukprot:jgi/Mesvir1/21650/Mv04071-RA.1